MWSSVQLQQAQSSESAAAVALQTSSSIGIKRRYEEAMAMAGQNDKMESAITAFEELLERISEEEEDAEEISEECRRIYYLSLSNLARLEASRSSSPTSPINLRVPFLRLLETAEEFEGRPEAAEILLRATRLGIRLNDAWTSSWTLRLYSSLSEKKRSSLDCAVHSLQREIAATPLPELRLPDLSWPLPSQPRTRRTVQSLPQEERTLSGVAVRGKGRSGEKITIERRITRLKSRGLESAVQENLTLTSSSSPELPETSVEKAIASEPIQVTTTNDDVNTVPAVQPLPQSLLLLLEALKTSQSDLAYIKSAARLLHEILGSNFPTAQGIDFPTLRHNVISSWNTLLVEWSSIGIDALVARLDFSEQLLLIELTLDAILSHTSRAVSANQHVSLDVLMRVAGTHTASSSPTSLIPKELPIRLLWSTLHLYAVMDIGDVTNTMDCGGLLDLLRLQLMTLPTQSMNLPHVSSPSISTITFECLNAFRHRFFDNTGLETLGQV